MKKTLSYVHVFDALIAHQSQDFNDPRLQSLINNYGHNLDKKDNEALVQAYIEHSIQNTEALFQAWVEHLATLDDILTLTAEIYKKHPDRHDVIIPLFNEIKIIEKTLEHLIATTVEINDDYLTSNDLHNNATKIRLLHQQYLEGSLQKAEINTGDHKKLMQSILGLSERIDAGNDRLATAYIQKAAQELVFLSALTYRDHNAMGSIFLTKADLYKSTKKHLSSASAAYSSNVSLITALTNTAYAIDNEEHQKRQAPTPKPRLH